MANKTISDETHRFDSKQMSGSKLFTMYIGAFVFIAVMFYPALLPRNFMHGGLFIIIVFLALISFAQWQAKKNIKNRFLLLSDTELKQITKNKEYTIPWNEIQLVKIAKNNRNEIERISILMRSGKLWNLSGYTDMQAIEKYIAKHTKTGKINGILNLIRINPGISGFIGYVLLIGIIAGWRFLHIPFELLFIPFIGLLIWMNPTREGTNLWKRLLKHYVFGFLFLCIIGALIFILIAIYVRQNH